MSLRGKLSETDGQWRNQTYLKWSMTILITIENINNVYYYFFLCTKKYQNFWNNATLRPEHKKNASNRLAYVSIANNPRSDAHTRTTLSFLATRRLDVAFPWQKGIIGFPRRPSAFDGLQTNCNGQYAAVQTDMSFLFQVMFHMIVLRKKNGIVKECQQRILKRRLIVSVRETKLWLTLVFSYKFVKTKLFSRQSACW